MNAEGLNAMDEIVAGLWLGDILAATNESLLREKDVHSVLSVMRGKVDVPRVCNSFFRLYVYLKYAVGDETHAC